MKQRFLVVVCRRSYTNVSGIYVQLQHGECFLAASVSPVWVISCSEVSLATVSAHCHWSAPLPIDDCLSLSLCLSLYQQHHCHPTKSR